MKIELPHAQLVAATSAVDRVSGKNMALPILSCVLLTAGKRGLSLRATNLELGIENVVPAKVTEEGVAAVPANVFANTVAHLRGVTPVSIESDDTTLTIRADGGTSRLKLHPSDEFPPLPKVKAETITLAASALGKALRGVVYAASPSTIKPELGSVHIFSRDHSLVAVATDSFRLAERVVPITKGVSLPSLLIPIRSVAEVIKMLDEVGEGDVELSIDEHQLGIAASGRYLTSRLIEGSFPDYQKIIPKDATTTVTLLKGDLVHILRKAAVFTDKFNQVKISIDSKAGTLGLFTQNADVGEEADTVSADITGDTLSVSFNQRYIADAFQSITTDSVTLSLSGAGKPMVIKGAGDASFTYLVMPMNR